MMSNDRPLAIDLCCGLGGWTAGLLAEGWRVWAFDIERPKSFPDGADLWIQDIRTFDARPYRGQVQLVVASPPCTEFSQTWNFNKARKPEPEKGVELVAHCQRIQRELGCLMLLENGAGAQRYIGRSVAHVGPYHFWGDVPLLLPYGRFQKSLWNTKKDRHGNKITRAPREGLKHVRDSAERSKIPIELARAVAAQMLPPAAVRPPARLITLPLVEEAVSVES